MIKERDLKSSSEITFNNAKAVFNKLKSQENFDDNFSTLVQGNTFKEVNISESNIRNNSRFIVDLWDSDYHE